MRLERHDEATGTWGLWPNAWRWEQLGGPDLARSWAGERFEAVGLSQPGEGDDGQPWA